MLQVHGQFGDQSRTEAHVLPGREVQNDLNEKDMYNIMCLCFYIFQRIPPGSLARSARARINADALQVPITEIPFDDLPIKPGTLKLEKLYDIEFMAQFSPNVSSCVVRVYRDHALTNA